MNEQNYTDLIATMPVAYALHEMLYNEKGEPVDYRFLDVNSAFEELTGLVASEVIGKTLLEMLPDSEPYWIEKFAECVRTGERVYYENFSQALNRHYQVIAYKYGDNRFITMFLDITDRKDEFQKAEDIASFYQTITENSFDGVVILNDELKFTYISPNSYKLFGYEPSEMHTLVPTELTHPDDLPYVLSEVQKLIENPNYQSTLEYRFRHKNGEWLWIEVKYSNFFNHHQVKGLLINFKVINDRKIREQKLKQSEALLSATLKHNWFNIWSVDLDYRLLYANEQFKNEFQQTFGVKLEVGTKIIDFLPPQLRNIWLERYKHTFENNSFVEEDVIDLGISKIYIEISTTPIIVDGKVTGASFYGQNITDRKVAELKLVESAHNLRLLLNASNHFVKPKTQHVNFDEVTALLSQLSGAKYVIFNRLFTDYSITVSMSGLENTRETILKYLGVDIVKNKWKREAAFESKWIDKKLTVLPDIGSILFSNFKPSVVQFIIDKFNVGNVAVVRIEGNDRVVGNLIFIYEKGKNVENAELIEMFTYQLGQYIERLNAEDALNLKMSEMERFHKLTVNRELNMIELKKEVNELLRKMGQEEKYRIVN